MTRNDRRSEVRKKERNSSPLSKLPAITKAGTSILLGSNPSSPPATTSSVDGLRKFIFATIALEKKAFRVLEIVAHSEKDARNQMPDEFGLVYITVQSTRSAKRVVRTRIIRDAETWACFLDRFFLTPKQFEQMMRKELLPPGASFHNPFQ